MLPTTSFTLSRLVRALVGVAVAASTVMSGVAVSHAEEAPPGTPAIGDVGRDAYGLMTFVYGHPDTTARDLDLLQRTTFKWQKLLVQWRTIEGACKGCFDWAETDRVVRASSAAGLKTIARLDFQPAWARREVANNGPPDDYQDYWDFVQAFVSRYASGSEIGRVDAAEIWNEPNLSREWGDQPISRRQAADYVRLLSGAYAAAKAADPGVTIITAGLSPTGVTDDQSADDVEYLRWLYSAGLKGGVNYDVLGAHGNAQAPEVSAEMGSLSEFPHASFYFRRVEQLRAIQEQNGDANHPIWLLEFGWTSDTIHPNYAWFAVSEDKKAANILEAFPYARAHWPWMGVMIVWTLSDPQWDPEREEFFWAIDNPDGSARPALSRIIAAADANQLP